MENLAHKPSIARMVHVIDSRTKGQPIAAVVTAVFPDNPYLAINATGFLPNGPTLPYYSIPHADSAAPGWEGATWIWPPRT